MTPINQGESSTEPEPGRAPEAPAPGQAATVVGLRITSQKEARMVAVSSPVAEAQMHSMTMENGMMKMRRLESLALPAGQEVVLGAGGDHLMLVGLKKPLKAGEVVPLTLTVEFADKLKKMGLRVPDLAFAGGFSTEDDILLPGSDVSGEQEIDNE